MEEYNFKLYSTFGKKFWYVDARKHLIQGILNRSFPKRTNLKILDAGCGTGFNFESLSNFGEVFGVDMNKSALAQAKRFPYKNLELNDVNQLKYENKFDVIIAIELIEHIREDVLVMKNFNKYLKKGGILILTTPAHKFLWSSDDDIAYHVRRYSKKRLRSVVNLSGLKIAYLGYRYFFMFFPSIIIFLIQKIRAKKTNSLEYTPKLMNKILIHLMRLENWLILNKLKLPFGVGLICIAKKR